jgi:mannan endo-1,4-beta-mannosidase
MKALRVLIAAVAIAAGAAVAVEAGIHYRSSASTPPPVADVFRVLPAQPQSYLGVYAPPAPDSYAGVSAFTQATGVRPTLVMYYSGWLEQFRLNFAESVAQHDAVVVIQMDPTGVSLSAIASGRYDAYLISYAEAVRSYGKAVIISFGHEMNGSWYSWGYHRSSPANFVAAWRHIVMVFRDAGADNVTWLWTVNVISRVQHKQIPNPAAWWPGSSYVTWVGIDGYYLGPSFRFVSLFGPTVIAIREITDDPILISETGASEAAGQASKIADLAAGVREYGLLGFVWFDARGAMDWRISEPAAISALHDAAQAYVGRGR